MTVHGKHIYNPRKSLNRMYSLYLNWQSSDMSEDRHWELADAANSGELIDLAGDLLQMINALQCEERYQNMTVREALADILYDDTRN